MGINNGDNASFSVQSKIFPRLKAQILQMGYQNIQVGLGFTVEGINLWKFQSIMFSSVKNRHFFDFLSINSIHYFTYYIIEFFNFFHSYIL